MQTKKVEVISAVLAIGHCNLQNLQYQTLEKIITLLLRSCFCTEWF